MNRKVFLTAIAAALMFAASCGTEDGDDSAIVQEPTTESVTQTDSQNVVETVATTRPIVIRATKGQSLSKVASSDGYTLTFEGTDKLVLKYADGSECATLDMVEGGAEQTTATFKGDIPTAADNKELYAEIGTALSGVATSTVSLAELVSTNCYVKSANFTYDPSKEIENVTLGDQNAYIAISLSPFSEVTSVTVNSREIALNEDKKVWVAVSGGTSVSVSELSVNDKTTVAGKIYKVIRGAFSVSSTEKVFFATGNLRYHVKNKTWSFAANQYDRIDAANSNISNPDYDGYIDLFGWGTWLEGANPMQTTNENSQYVWNDNAPAIGNQWFTLSKAQWEYLALREEGRLQKKTTVCSEFGLVILPDGCTESIADSYDENAWSVLEKKGAVFLPACGWRNVTSISQYSYANNDHETGYYWTSTSDASDNSKAYDYIFTDANHSNYMNTVAHTKYDGFSVRLVRF